VVLASAPFAFHTAPSLICAGLRDGEHEHEQPPIDRETFVQAAAEANRHPPGLRHFN
jgi:hypothetical protein